MSLGCPSDNKASVVEFLVTYGIRLKEDGIATSSGTLKRKLLLVKRTACIAVNPTESTIVPGQLC